VAPNSLQLKIRDCWDEYNVALTNNERDSVSLRLLSYLGTLRYISGTASEMWQKISNQMNFLRQNMAARQRAYEKSQLRALEEQSSAMMLGSSDPPFELT